MHAEEEGGEQEERGSYQGARRLEALGSEEVTGAARAAGAGERARFGLKRGSGVDDLGFGMEVRFLLIDWSRNAASLCLPGRPRVASFPVLEADHIGPPLYQAGGLELRVQRRLCCHAGVEERYEDGEAKEEEIHPWQRVGGMDACCCGGLRVISILLHMGV